MSKRIEDSLDVLRLIRDSYLNLWAEVPGNKAAWKWVKEQDRMP